MPISKLGPFCSHADGARRNRSFDWICRTAADHQSVYIWLPNYGSVEKAPRHFLQPYSGVALPRGKGHSRFAVRERRADLTSAASREKPEPETKTSAFWYVKNSVEQA